MKSPEMNIIKISLMLLSRPVFFHMQPYRMVLVSKKRHIRLFETSLTCLKDAGDSLNIHNAKPSKPSTSLSSASYHTTSYHTIKPLQWMTWGHAEVRLKTSDGQPGGACCR